MKRANDLPALTGLRGVLALWVVAFHITYVLRAVQFPVEQYLPAFVVHGLSVGNVGVDGFFILSGFVLSHVYTAELTQSLSWPSARRFLELRLARVYPVHLTVLATYVALKLAGVTFQVENCGLPVEDAAVQMACKRFDLPGLISHLTLTATWGWYEPLTWNSPAWSISAEWAAYLAFPLLVQGVSRLRNGALALLLALASIAALVAVLAREGMPPAIIPVDDLTLARIGFEFLAGMLMYRSSVSPLFQRIPWHAVALICLAVTLGLLQLRAHAYAFVFVFVFLILSLAQPRGPVSQLLSTRIMLWLGAVSYPLYMCHLLVIDVLGAMAGSDDSANPMSGLEALGLASFILMLALAVASALHYGVEEPCRRALRRFIER